MKLTDLTAELLNQAIEIYLKLAYPSGALPKRVQRLLDFQDKGIEAILASSSFEKYPSGIPLSQVDKFHIRLGNDKYPHMKLGFERISDEDQFVFTVDTHDKHFALDPTIPGYDELVVLRRHNKKLAQEIEERWEEAGVKTIHRYWERLRNAVAQEPNGYACNGRRILIVDDDPEIMHLEELVLSKKGCEVLTASNGRQALEMVLEGGPVDVCLLDIMMEEMNGYQFIEELELLDRRDFPIIFVSAMIERNVRSDMAEGYIKKPFNPAFLLKKVEEALKAFQRD